MQKSGEGIIQTTKKNKRALVLFDYCHVLCTTDSAKQKYITSSQKQSMLEISLNSVQDILKIFYF